MVAASGHRAARMLETCKAHGPDMDADTGPPLASSARAVLLCEGFAAVAVQLCAVRALAPVAGVSVATTSVAVCAFVAGLACGYAWSGHAGGRRPPGVAACLGVAGVLAAGGLEPAWYAGLGASMAVAAVAVLLAAIGTLLGRCVVAVGVALAGGGAAVGTAFGWSTLGNVVAAGAVPFATMRYAGVATTAALAGALLVWASLWLSAASRPGTSPERSRWRRIGCGVLAAAAVVWVAEGWRRDDAGLPPMVAVAGDAYAGEAARVQAWARERLPDVELVAAGMVGVESLRRARAGLATGRRVAVVWEAGAGPPSRRDRRLENTVREVFALCERLHAERMRGLVCETSPIDGTVETYRDRRTTAEVDAGWRISGEVTAPR